MSASFVDLLLFSGCLRSNGDPHGTFESLTYQSLLKQYKQKERIHRFGKLLNERILILKKHT